MFTNISFKAQKPYYGMGSRSNRVNSDIIEQNRERDRQNGVYRKYPQYTSPLFKDEQHKARFSPKIETQPIQDVFVPQQQVQYEKFDGVQAEEDIESVEILDENDDDNIEELEIIDEDAEEEAQARKDKQVAIERGVCSALVLLTAVGCGTAINHDYQQNKQDVGTVLIDYVDDASLIKDVVDTYGADLGMVAVYNMENPFTPEGKDGFYIPYAYKPAEEKIETLQKKLFDNDLDAMEANKIRVEIGGLEKKAERQHDLAYAYQEGKYIHFITRDYVLTKEFEKAFDIKEGKLQKLNEKTNEYEKYDAEIMNIGKTYRVKAKYIKD